MSTVPVAETIGTRAALVAMAAAAALSLAAASTTLGRGLPSAAIQNAAASTTMVDVQLVIAVDVSYSMDPDEQALQREGYIAGLTSPEFMRALREGMHGKVAVTYFEWAGPYDQKVIVPWRLIDGPEAADAFASEIAAAPYRRASRTSISGALIFAKPLFEGSDFQGIRRVIDVSGDGANNSGSPVTPGTACLPAASPSTVSRSCSSDPTRSPWTSRTWTSTTRIALSVALAPLSFPSASAPSSKTRRAPSFSSKWPDVCLSALWCQRPHRRRASPAPLASRCGANAGETEHYQLRRHCEEQGDEAIQNSAAQDWIASLRSQ
jgi:Protein of unknown function (DUF1194)